MHSRKSSTEGDFGGVSIFNYPNDDAGRPVSVRNVGRARMIAQRSGLLSDHRPVQDPPAGRLRTVRVVSRPSSAWFSLRLQCEVRGACATCDTKPVTAILPPSTTLVGANVTLTPMARHDVPELYRAIGRKEVFASGYGGGLAALPANLDAFEKFVDSYYLDGDASLAWTVRVERVSRRGGSSAQRGWATSTFVTRAPTLEPPHTHPTFGERP